MMDKSYTVEIYNEHLHSFGETQGLRDFIAWAQEMLESVPEQYRESAAIKISCEEEYDSSWAELSITYDRPETDSEKREREAYEAGRQAETLAHELRQLAALQAKYSGKSYD